MPSVLVYTGLVSAFVGFVSLLKPIRFLKIPTRGRGAAVLAVGLLTTLAGAMLPAPLMHARGGPMRLDDFMPEFQFHEVHSVRVKASPDRVFKAMKDVTPEEIRFFRTLSWIRSPHFGQAPNESILNAPPKKPILDVALSSGFALLAEEPDRELVLGTIIAGENGNPTVTATMNFLLEAEGTSACSLRTETRVFAKNPRARRMFAVYWRLIYPGSSIIRRMWLAAIQRRAEGVP